MLATYASLLRTYFTYTTTYLRNHVPTQPLTYPPTFLLTNYLLFLLAYLNVLTSPAAYARGVASTDAATWRRVYLHPGRIG